MAQITCGHYTDWPIQRVYNYIQSQVLYKRAKGALIHDQGKVACQFLPQCLNAFSPQIRAEWLNCHYYIKVWKGNELQNTENQKWSYITAYLDNTHFGSLPVLGWNCLCVVKVPSVLANTLLRGRRNLGLSCMTLEDMQEYLHNTQTISIKCKHTTRAVSMYIGNDQKLIYRF